MRHLTVPALAALAALVIALPASAGEGWKLVGEQGVMHMVQVDEAQAANLDTYRLAVADVCRQDRICQVMFWTDNAPSSLPMTDAQVSSKTAHWQVNMNTGLRRWLLDCDLFGTAHGEACL